MKRDKMEIILFIYLEIVGENKAITHRKKAEVA